MKWILYSFCLLFCSMNLFAQDEVELKLVVQPGNTIVKIDNQIIELNNQIPYVLKKKPGVYEIEIWAKYYAVVKDTIVIEADKPYLYRKGLVVQSVAYKKYKEELKVYKRKKAIINIGHGGLIAGNIALAWFLIDGGSIKKIKDQKANSEDLYEAYQNTIAPLELENIRTTYEENADEFEQTKRIARIKRIAALPVLVSSSWLTYKIFKKNKEKVHSWEKPVYEEKSPFSGIMLTPDDNTMLGMNLRFNF